MKYYSPVLVLGRRGYVLSDCIKDIVKVKFSNGRLYRRIDGVIFDLLRQLISKDRLSSWVICDSFEYYWLAMIIKVIFRKNLAIRIRGSAIEEVLSGRVGSFPLIVRLIQAYYSFALKYSDKIIPVCKYLADQLPLEYHGKIDIIPIGVSNLKPQNLKLERTNAVIIMNFKFKMKVYENLDYLETIERALNYADIKLIILGEGPYLSHFQHEVFRREGLKSRVEFVGFSRRVYSFLENSKYFFHFSGLDGMPRVILEAMAQGCITFATNKFGIPEVIDHKVDGFLVNDPEHFFSLFKKVNDNSELGDSISKNARAKINTCFHHKKISMSWREYCKANSK